MFVRFVPVAEVADSDYEWSLFGAIGHPLDSGGLADYNRSRLHDIDNWFENHLRKPSRLSRSSKPRSNEDAVCWFKSTAHKCIANIHEAVSILEQYNIKIQMVTYKPGYIVYEDEYQIAAVPFRRKS